MGTKFNDYHFAFERKIFLKIDKIYLKIIMSSRLACEETGKALAVKKEIEMKTYSMILHVC